MKRIIFPATNRVHLARQKNLLHELQKDFEVDVFTPHVSSEAGLEAYSILTAVEFRNFLQGKEYDLGLIRADRFELLPLAGILAYRGIKIAHIEGGAESGAGVIDTKIRDAITQLSNIHFVTDHRAKKRVQAFGAENVHDVGSLDVSFAKRISKKSKPVISGDYILALHHAIPGEDTETLLEAAKKTGMKVVGISSNSDYQTSLMTEEYSPEDFISVVQHAKCFLGNSSALCKESSILGTPGVLTGRRQDGRITGHNVVRVAHDRKRIEQAIRFQLENGKYEPDEVYYKPDTERTIAKILKEYPR